MERLNLTFEPYSSGDPATFQSFDSFSNVVAYDTEFQSPPVFPVSQKRNDVDLKREMKMMVKEVYSETAAFPRSQKTQENVQGFSSSNHVRHGSGMQVDNQTEENDFLTKDRPTPTGACSDEETANFHSNLRDERTLNMAQTGAHHTVEAEVKLQRLNPVVGVHSSRRSSDSTSRKHTSANKKAPLIQGDLDKHPDLIRVKSPEILREQKVATPKTNEVQSIENTSAAQNFNPIQSVGNISRSSSDSEFVSSPKAVGSVDSRFDSGVFSPNLEQPSEAMPPRPLHMSTPMAGHRAPARDFNPVRLDLTAAEGRSRSSSEVSQNVPAKHDSSFDMIMQERAHLEGQVEMITKEANSALEEKAKLHAMVISLQSALAAKSKASSATGVAKHDEQNNSLQLQVQLTDLEEAVEEKASKAKELAVDLESAMRKNGKLLEQMRALQTDMGDRENSIQRLKNQITQLHSEVEAAMNIKMQLMGEIKSMQGDHESLVSAKDWYQEQLQFAQEARVQLQNELTVLQSKTVQQATLIEQLKVQNTQVNHDLNYSHQMALQEKESLARHLEVIEADMMQREAGFERVRLEHRQAEEKLQDKIQLVNAEKEQIASLVSKMANLEAELEQKEELLKSKQVAIKELETSFSELNANLYKAQQVVHDRDCELQLLKQRYSETNTNLSEAVLQTGNKDELIQQLKMDKQKLEFALKDALAEKENYDHAIKTLKGDMIQVESNFRQMKQDLSEKKQELENLQVDNTTLKGLVEKLQEKLSTQTTTFESQSIHMKDRNELLIQTEQQKDDLEKEIRSLKEELTQVQIAYHSASQEKVVLQEELISVKQHYQDVESQLQGVLNEKAHLEGQLEYVNVEQNKMGQISRENADLKTKVAQLEARIGDELSDNGAKIAQLKSDLKECRYELKQKEKQGESSVALLTKKLRETMEAKEACERTVESLQTRSPDVQVVEEWKFKAQSAISELDKVSEQKRMVDIQIQQLETALSQDVSQYQLTIAALEKQVDEGRKQDSRRMLELERERGRLAGVLQSHKALKQHSDVLEDAVARRGVLLNEVKSQHEDDIAAWEQKDSKHTQRIHHLEDGLKKEKGVVKELKKKLMSTEKEKSSLETSLLDIQSQLDTMKADKTSSVEMERLTNQMSALEAENHKSYLVSEEVRVENRRLVSEVDALRRGLSDSEDRLTMFTDQVESMKWLVEQKTREVDSFNNQLRLSEDRHEVEIHNFNKALKASRVELETVKAELSSTRKSKYMFQAKLSELKDTLKSKAKRQSTDGESGTATPVQLNVGEIERILQSDLAPLNLSSQPLERLRSCLAGLRGEMSGLEQRVVQHTVDLESSSASWRQVEGMVKSVKEACEMKPHEVDIPRKEDEQSVQKAIHGLVDV